MNYPADECWIPTEDSASVKINGVEMALRFYEGVPGRTEDAFGADVAVYDGKETLTYHIHGESYGEILSKLCDVVKK